MDLGILIDPVTDLPRLSQVLDELGPLGRLHCVLGWEPHKLAKLYDALAGFRPATLDDLVPGDVPDGEDATCKGNLSATMFTHFEARFAKAPAVEGTDGQTSAAPVWGFLQRSPSFLGGAAFVARQVEAELELDHRQVPTGAIKGWPAASSFSAKPQVDKLRALTGHILLGRAHHANGAALEPRDHWFALCRLDREASS